MGASGKPRPAQRRTTLPRPRHSEAEGRRIRIPRPCAFLLRKRSEKTDSSLSLRPRKVRFTLFPPNGENSLRSLARPLTTRPTSLGSCCVKDGGYGFFAVAQNDGGRPGTGPEGGRPAPFTPSVRLRRTAPPSRGSYHGAPGRRAPQKRAASLHHVLTYRVKRGRCKSSARWFYAYGAQIQSSFAYSYFQNSPRPGLRNRAQGPDTFRVRSGIKVLLPTLTSKTVLTLVSVTGRRGQIRSTSGAV